MAWEHEEQHTTQEWIDMLTDRLAAYEDVGLEPEEIQELIDEEVFELASLLHRMIESGRAEWLRDLVKANEEGRVVVLPCKMGDTVYTTHWWEEVPETCTDSRGEKFQRTIRRQKVGEEIFSPFSLAYLRFGKTVFLTREEAEAALKGEQA